MGNVARLGFLESLCGWAVSGLVLLGLMHGQARVCWAGLSEPIHAHLLCPDRVCSMTLDRLVAWIFPFFPRSRFSDA